MMILITACLGSAVTVPSEIAGASDESPTPVSLSAAELADARRFREGFGLRADDDWILAVTENPASRAGTERYSIPLLPFEVNDLQARISASSGIGPIILDYAATVPDDWYGSHIDQQRRGIVVAEFRQNADQHRAILSRVLPATGWEVRQISQHTIDLEAFVTRVKADRAWFATIDAELLDVFASPLDGGVVEISYVAQRRDLDSTIVDHYGAPTWLVLDAQYQSPPWTGPVGDLVINVVDPKGRPVADLTCSIGGSSVYATDQNGACRIRDLAAVEYRVEIWGGIEEARTVVGLGTVTVLPGGPTMVTIVVTP